MKIGDRVKILAGSLKNHYGSITRILPERWEDSGIRRDFRIVVKIDHMEIQLPASEFYAAGESVFSEKELEICIEE